MEQNKHVNNTTHRSQNQTALRYAQVTFVIVVLIGFKQVAQFLFGRMQYLKNYTSGIKVLLLKQIEAQYSIQILCVKILIVSLYLNVILALVIYLKNRQIQTVVQKYKRLRRATTTEAQGVQKDDLQKSQKSFEDNLKQIKYNIIKSKDKEYQKPMQVQSLLRNNYKDQYQKMPKQKMYLSERNLNNIRQQKQVQQNLGQKQDQGKQHEPLQIKQKQVRDKKEDQILNNQNEIQPISDEQGSFGSTTHIQEQNQVLQDQQNIKQKYSDITQQNKQSLAQGNLQLQREQKQSQKNQNQQEMNHNINGNNEIQQVVPIKQSLDTAYLDNKIPLLQNTKGVKKKVDPYLSYLKESTDSLDEVQEQQRQNQQDLQNFKHQNKKGYNLQNIDNQNLYEDTQNDHNNNRNNHNQQAQNYYKLDQQNQQQLDQVKQYKQKKNDLSTTKVASFLKELVPERTRTKGIEPE